MKKVYTLIAILAIAYAGNAQRTLIKATTSGNWSSTGTWSLGRLPANGDSIVIGSGVTVTLTANVSRSNVILDIVGILSINEPASGTIDLTLTPATGYTGTTPMVRLYNTSAKIQRGTNSAGSGRVIVVTSSNITKYTTSGTAQAGPAAAFANNTASFDNTTNASLPVVLVSFDAVKQSTGVALSWKTQQEQNTKAFIVEKSSNGADYKAIGSVPAAGNSSTPLSYAFNDASAVSGIVYYRVRIVDLDGKEGFTPVKAVRASANAVKLGVYPNPAVSVANVVVDNAEQVSFSLNVFNRNGQLVAQQRAAAGTNAVNVDVSRFAAGDYMIDVQFANGNRQSSKLIVAQH